MLQHPLDLFYGSLPSHIFECHVSNDLRQSRGFICPTRIAPHTIYMVSRWTLTIDECPTVLHRGTLSLVVLAPHIGSIGSWVYLDIEADEWICKAIVEGEVVWPIWMKIVIGRLDDVFIFTELLVDRSGHGSKLSTVFLTEPV